MHEEPTDRFSLFGFKVDRILGRGGSGVVYRGFHPETGQPVAMKLFHENFFSNAGHVRDLARSVKTFQTFEHPNVVRIYGFLSGDEGHCLLEEYIDGPDMRWYLENRPYDMQERLVIITQALNGLQYIHDQGFTHHDVKPANVLFTRKGQAKLVDYSLSRQGLLSMLTGRGGTDQVTPMYVAPEIIRKERPTPRSDIYSLGITMYYMFTGQLPFQADSLQKLYYCHLRVVPEHPSVINRRCPRNLGDAIMRAIEKDPARRWESCDQLRIRLADIGRSRI